MLECGAMRVEPNTFVTVRYVLRSDKGEVLDAGEEPIEYVHGYGMLVPGLEAALAGRAAGEKQSVTLEPDEAFGPHDEEMVLAVEPSELPKGVKVGDELVLEEDGEAVPVRVVSVTKDQALVDANHPLAGQRVAYDFEVLSVRAATEAEVLAAAAILDELESADEPPEDLVPLRRK